MNWMTREQAIHHFKLIYEVGRLQWQLQAIVLCGSLNLLVKEFNASSLLFYDSIGTLVENNYAQLSMPWWVI